MILLISLGAVGAVLCISGFLLFFRARRTRNYTIKPNHEEKDALAMLILFIREVSWDTVGQPREPVIEQQ